MSDNSTATAKNAGFNQQPDSANLQAAGGCCGQTNSNITLVSSAAAASGCCGTPVSDDAGLTACCGTPGGQSDCC